MAASVALAGLDALWHAPIGIALIDTGLCYLRVNKALAEMNELPATEHLGRRIDEVLPADSEATRAIIRRVEHVLATGHPLENIEVEWQSAGATRVPHFSRTSYYPIQNGSTLLGVCVYVEDLRAQRRAEQQRDELVERERHARAEAEAAAQRLFILAEASHVFAEASADLRSVVNAVVRMVATIIDGVCALFLLSEDGQEVAPVAAYHSDPEARKALEALVEHAGHSVNEGVAGLVVRTGQSLLVPRVSCSELRGFLPESQRSYVERYPPRSMMVVPLRVYGRVIGTLQVSREETERPFSPPDLVFLEELADRAGLAIQNARLLEREKESRAEAENERARLHALVTQAPAAIAIMRGPDFVFEFTNPLYEKFSGRTGLVGKPLREALPELAQQPGYVDVLSAVLRTGEPFVGHEYPVALDRRGDGTLEEAFLNLVYQPLHDAQGRVDGLLTHAVDVTELVRARRRAEALEQQARRQAEFEQQLIGIVSHDLRNPVSAILMSAQMLLKQEGLGERAFKGASRILSSAERATRLIGDLLDFTQARLGGGIRIQRRATSLHELMRQVLEEIQAAWPERDIQSSQGGDGQGEWDPDRLAQVVTNLVTNALRYGAPGTPVRVSTRAEEDAVLIEVHNLGRPIPPELLPHLFEAMKRGSHDQERSGRSVGLGLYIVQQIVRAHRGTVSVRSTEAEGTTFTVQLPRRA
ncbi:ATP-binding protein [Hyalangium gracile]|uniref:ATP-binding protein n=1 Tax=Hyalangium gracile TaxID=394092 RepID=UPI001CCF6533|nr:ATP-binding protein [Hyalangium gracile]